MVQLFNDVIYKIFLVSYFEIDPFSIACQVEYVLILGLCVLEMAGFLLADTGSIGSDEVSVYIIRYRHKLGASDVYDFLTDYKMYSKSVSLNGVLRRYGT